jgi:WD40 repeat protein
MQVEAITPEGRWLISTGESHRFNVVGPCGAVKEIQSLERRGVRCIGVLDFIPEWPRLCALDGDGVLRVYDLHTGLVEAKADLRFETSAHMLTTACGRNGLIVATADNPDAVYLYRFDLTERSLGLLSKAPAKGGNSRSWRVALPNSAASGREAVSVVADRTARMVDLPTSGSTASATGDVEHIATVSDVDQVKVSWNCTGTELLIESENCTTQLSRHGRTLRRIV